jgi:hypothetical protein
MRLDDSDQIEIAVGIEEAVCLRPPSRDVAEQHLGGLELLLLQISRISRIVIRWVLGLSWAKDASTSHTGELHLTADIQLDALQLGAGVRSCSSELFVGVIPQKSSSLIVALLLLIITLLLLNPPKDRLDPWGVGNH